MGESYRSRNNWVDWRDARGQGPSAVVSRPNALVKEVERGPEP